MEKEEAVIELDKVVLDAGDYRILQETSCRFERGKISMIMGGAGSGKSSLLKVAAGLMIPDSGTVRFEGRNMDSFTQAEETDFRKRSSFVFQDNALWANQTALYNLTLPLHVHRPEIDDVRANELAYCVAESLGFNETLAVRPAVLSAGEQHVIALARAFVLDPEIYFMDQPLSHLDDDSRDRFTALVEELRKRGRTLVVVTNSAEFARRFADALFVIVHGRIAESGTPAEVLASKDPDVRAIVARVGSGKADEAMAEDKPDTPGTPEGAEEEST